MRVALLCLTRITKPHPNGLVLSFRLVLRVSYLDQDGRLAVATAATPYDSQFLLTNQPPSRLSGNPLPLAVYHQRHRAHGGIIGQSASGCKWQSYETNSTNQQDGDGHGDTARHTSTNLPIAIRASSGCCVLRRGLPQNFPKLDEAGGREYAKNWQMRACGLGRTRHSTGAVQAQRQRRVTPCTPTRALHFHVHRRRTGRFSRPRHSQGSEPVDVLITSSYPVKKSLPFATLKICSSSFAVAIFRQCRGRSAPPPSSAPSVI